MDKQPAEPVEELGSKQSWIVPMEVDEVLRRAGTPRMLRCSRLLL